MRILIAEDDPVSRRMLEVLLVKTGHTVEAVNDGAAAWTILQQPDAPHLAILDWMMPELDGVEICRRLRSPPHIRPTYIILLTARDRSEDLIAGLEAGANDYVTKPFDAAELRARVQVGVRVAELQQSLAERVRELEEALANVRQLQGLLPMCSYCKKIRDDSNYWQQVEHYVATHSEAKFSHGICPECWDRVVKPQLEEMDDKRG